MKFKDTLAQGVIPVVTSRHMKSYLIHCIQILFVDAILVKRILVPNVMMQISLLVWVLDLLRGHDVDVVIETMRGHFRSLHL